MVEVIVLVFIIWIAWQEIRYFTGARDYKCHPEDHSVQPPQSTILTFRCPNCGAEARVNGDQWDCGFCGDCGRLTYK